MKRKWIAILVIVALSFLFVDVYVNRAPLYRAYVRRVVLIGLEL